MGILSSRSRNKHKVVTSGPATDWVVDAVGQSFYNQTSMSPSRSSAPPAGAAMMAIQYFSQGSSITGVTFSGICSSWTINENVTASANSSRLVIATGISNGTSPTLNISWTGTGQGISAFFTCVPPSGVTSPVFDTATFATNWSSTYPNTGTAPISGSVTSGTPAISDEIFISGFINSQNNDAATPSGWTFGVSNSRGATGDDMVTVYKIGNSSAQTCAWVYPTATSVGSFIASIKFSGTPSGTTPPVTGGGGSVQGPSFTSLVVLPETQTLSAGQSQQLSATANFSDNSFQDVRTLTTWTTTDPTIVTVNNVGFMTAASLTTASQATVTGTYTTGGVTKYDTCVVSVTPVVVTPPTGGGTAPAVPGNPFPTSPGLSATWLGDDYSGINGQGNMTACTAMNVISNGSQAVVQLLSSWTEDAYEFRDYRAPSSPGTYAVGVTGSGPNMSLHEDIVNGGQFVGYYGGHTYVGGGWGSKTNPNSRKPLIFRYNTNLSGTNTNYQSSPFTGSDTYTFVDGSVTTHGRNMDDQNIAAGGARSGYYGWAGAGCIDQVNGKLYIVNPQYTLNGSDLVTNPTQGEPDHTHAYQYIANAVVMCFNLSATGADLVYNHQFNLPGCRSLSFDGTNLWALIQGSVTGQAAAGSGNANNTIIQINPSTGATIQTLPKGSLDSTNWRDVYCDLHNNRIVVSDQGPDFNWKVWNGFSSPTRGADIGTVGGYLAGPTPGLLGPGRSVGPRFYCSDSSGNYYTMSSPNSGWNIAGNQPQGSGEGTILEAYNSSGQRIWRNFMHHYANAASYDPQDTVAPVWDTSYRFKWNPLTGAWQEYSRTIDPINHSGDMRLSNNNQGILEGGVNDQVHAGGQKFYSATGSPGAPPSNQMGIWKAIPNSEIIVQCSSISVTSPLAAVPASVGAVIWRDIDNSGSTPNYPSAEYIVPSTPLVGYTGFNWYVDSSGGRWCCVMGTNRQIWQWKYQGLDSVNNPIYGWGSGAFNQWSLPGVSGAAGTAWTEVNSICYNQPQDVLYCIGFTNTNPRPGGQKPEFCGDVIARYNNWAGINGARSLAWANYLTSDSQQTNSDVGHKATALSWAGNYLYVGFFNGDNDSATSPSNIEAYNISDGSFKYHVDQGNVTTVGGGGALDAGNGIRAYDISSNQHAIFQENDRSNFILVNQWCSA